MIVPAMSTDEVVYENDPTQPGIFKVYEEGYLTEHPVMM
jgi:hypothetical protein